MNLVAKFKNDAEVPIPPLGYGTVFISQTGSPKVKLPSGDVLTLQGEQGIKGDTGQPAVISGVSMEFISASGEPSVENTGTEQDVNLLFKLPQPNTRRKTIEVSFTDGDFVKTIGVTDALVTPSLPPCGFTVMCPATDENNLELSYSVVLNSVQVGTFIFTVSVFDSEGGDLLGHTLPAIIISYLTGV